MLPASCSAVQQVLVNALLTVLQYGLLTFQISAMATTPNTISVPALTLPTQHGSV
jgi:hypothetical protein